MKGEVIPTATAEPFKATKEVEGQNWDKMCFYI